MDKGCICSIDGCGKPVVGRGWCSTHHKRWYLYGDPCAPDRRNKRLPCREDGCSELSIAKGLCAKHYQRLKKHGHTGKSSTSPGEADSYLRSLVGHKGDDCVIWPFSRTKYGYGSVGSANFGTTLAHRAVCIIAHGPPPSDNHEAAHNCGKGHEGCVNPNHLRWDTRKGNMADKLRHGTAPRGENCGMAKLKQAEVNVIRSVKTTKSARMLAEEYGVSERTIHRIWNGHRWANS